MNLYRWQMRTTPPPGLQSSGLVPHISSAFEADGVKTGSKNADDLAPNRTGSSALTVIRIELQIADADHSASRSSPPHHSGFIHPVLFLLWSVVERVKNTSNLNL
jgi:hypothetical protein